MNAELKAPREVHEVRFFYDPISPYAHLAFHLLPATLMGLSVRVRYVPVLFAALLKAHGQLGPAEIPSKRDWTYRHVSWLGHHHGIALELPKLHPFNPLPLLRLGLACAMPEAPGETNRYVTEQLFQHVWQGGEDASDLGRLAQLQTVLQDHMAQRGKPWSWPDSDEVKHQLRANTDAAVALRLFGVPSFEVGGRVFWGQDALPMLRAYLDGDAWFEAGNWAETAERPMGMQRR